MKTSCATLWLKIPLVLLSPPQNRLFMPTALFNSTKTLYLGRILKTALRLSHVVFFEFLGPRLIPGLSLLSRSLGNITFLLRHYLKKKKPGLTVNDDCDSWDWGDNDTGHEWMDRRLSTVLIGTEEKWVIKAGRTRPRLSLWCDRRLCWTITFTFR